MNILKDENSLEHEYKNNKDYALKDFTWKNSLKRGFYGIGNETFLNELYIYNI